MVWSVFSIEVKEQLTWTTHTRLFMGDLSNIDLTTDWRFCDVKGKRRNCIFLGFIDNPEFPLKEPIKTYRNN
jgi:hypothetical protein